MLATIAVFICLGLCDPQEPTVLEWYQLPQFPVIVSVYDPALGGINCDSSCDTIATGQLEPWMYGGIAACDLRLLRATITIPGIGSYRCLDTGGAIGLRWSAAYQRYVVVFDVLYDLVGQEAPAWTYSLVSGWSISW
jgi:hypothetical protein